MRHRPHQGAQKFTNPGVEADKTSVSNVLSLMDVSMAIKESFKGEKFLLKQSRYRCSCRNIKPKYQASGEINVSCNN
jgi:hypothetical protein